jgi:nitrogen fixation-related uncharacterized protein
MKKLTGLILGILIFVLIIGGIIWWLEAGQRDDRDSDKITELSDFIYDGSARQFVAEGRNLSQIDVLGIQTEGDVAESEYENLGEMTIESEDKNQIWVLPVPTFPLAINEIIAVGYDNTGAEVGRLVLPIRGAEEIYNTLWLQIPFEEAILSLGESFTVDNLTLKLIGIAEDSRCPVGVECIQAGRVTADVEVTVDGRTSMVSLRSDETERRFGEDFFVNIVNINPSATEGRTIASTEYEITFYITKEIAKL